MEAPEDAALRNAADVEHTEPGPVEKAVSPEDVVKSRASAQKRLMADYKTAQQDTSFVSGPVEDDLFHWTATITGPDSTEWEGGIFHLDLVFSNEYPNVPPRVKFLTQGIFHPNVYVSGDICLDILKSRWSPTYDVSALLLSIQSLLSDPNPSSAANPEAATAFQQNRQLYDRRITELVERTLREAEDSDEEG